MKKTKFYAYKIVATKETGIVDNWKECASKTQGVHAKYKGFTSKTDAQKWIDSGAEYEKKPRTTTKKKLSKEAILNIKLRSGIYFDAGTGRGDGVEVRISDKYGKSLINNSILKTIKLICIIITYLVKILQIIMASLLVYF